jgi:hypothetical protein
MTPFILNGKGWVESQTAERERERERERRSVAADGLRRWAINLTVGPIFITARERTKLDLIKMNIKIICKNLDG